MTSDSGSRPEGRDAQQARGEARQSGGEANRPKEAAMTSPNAGLVERVVLPEAPHWNGYGKYGPALCMDECTLHIMSRGFGTKDGDGYLTFDPNKFDWDRDDEGGEFMSVPLSNSDLLFLRDQLNKLFPALPPQTDNALVEALPRGRDYIDEEALNRWRWHKDDSRNGHDMAANFNTVWRLVATIDYLRAALAAQPTSGASE